MSMVGQLNEGGEGTELDALAMANSYFNMTGLAIQYGLNSALRTLCPQASCDCLHSLSPPPPLPLPSLSTTLALHRRHSHDPHAIHTPHPTPHTLPPHPKMLHPTPTSSHPIPPHPQPTTHNPLRATPTSPPHHQAVGSGRSRQLNGIYVQRAAILATIALVPSLLLALHAKSLLILAGQPSDVAVMAQAYILRVLPALAGIAYMTVLQRVLQVSRPKPETKP
jgi:hypothetical protein